MKGSIPMKIWFRDTWGGATPFQVEGGHRHRRREERRLEVQGHQQTEKQGIDVEVGQERDEDRHEDDDDLRPFQGPAQQEDDAPAP